MKFKLARCLALATLFTIPLYPQTSKTTGTLKGRVFAISAAGGLLPARMAKGWVLSCRKVNALDEEYQDACTFFAKSFAYRSERMACGISSYCLKMAAMNSIEDAIKWAHLHNTEVVPFMTDEEGFFKAGPLKENVVMVFAYGQSGMQQCIWSESGIVFKFAGFENNIKLSKPVIAWQ